MTLVTTLWVSCDDRSWHHWQPFMYQKNGCFGFQFECFACVHNMAEKAVVEDIYAIKLREKVYHFHGGSQCNRQEMQSFWHKSIQAALLGIDGHDSNDKQRKLTSLLLQHSQSYSQETFNNNIMGHRLGTLDKLGGSSRYFPEALKCSSNAEHYSEWTRWNWTLWRCD